MHRIVARHQVFDLRYDSIAVRSHLEAHGLISHGIERRRHFALLEFDRVRLRDVRRTAVYGVRRVGLLLRLIHDTGRRHRVADHVLDL